MRAMQHSDVVMRPTSLNIIRILLPVALATIMIFSVAVDGQPMSVINNLRQHVPDNLTLEEAHHPDVATRNLGNVIWRHAVDILLYPPVYRIAGDFSDLSADELSNITFTIAATANILWNESRYERVRPYTLALHSIASSAPVPTLLVGIGISAPLLSNPKDMTLHEEQRSMLRDFAEKAGVFAVRGPFTRAVCEANGVTGAVVLGCPSLMINSNPCLGRLLEQKIERLKSTFNWNTRMAINLPANVGHSAMRFLVYTLSHCNNCSIILQDHNDERLVKRLQKSFNVSLPSREVKYFYRALDWIEALKGYEVVVGFRIHGSMAAVAGGVPPIVIAPDMRVKELCDVMHIPTVSQTDDVFMDGKVDVVDLFKAAAFDGADFDKRRNDIANQYAGILKRHEAKLHPRLDDVLSDAHTTCRVEVQG